jgi:hypothetical protein
MAGRPKGSTDKRAAAERFVQRVETILGKANPQMGGTLERQACRWLGSDNPKASVTVLMRLLEMKYGKTPQPISGDPERPLEVICKVVHLETSA